MSEQASKDAVVARDYHIRMYNHKRYTETLLGGGGAFPAGGGEGGGAPGGGGGGGGGVRSAG